MQALVILLSLAWFAITCRAALRLWRVKGRRLVAFGTMLTAVLAPLMALLVLSGTVDYYGEGFHESSPWLKSAIVLVAANLALGYVCLVDLPGRHTSAMNAMRVFGIACMSLVAVTLAVIGVRDGFPAASWLHYMLLIGMAVAGLAGLGVAVAWLRQRGRVGSRP